MQDRQEPNTNDKAPTIDQEGPCGFSCGDCARKGDCDAPAKAMGEIGLDWSKAKPEEILRDIIAVFSFTRETAIEDCWQFPISIDNLRKMGIFVFPEPQYKFSNPVWRGHRFIVSDDAREISRYCSQSLRTKIRYMPASGSNPTAQCGVEFVMFDNGGTINTEGDLGMSGE